jgi:SAM-dependent methyltransferase
VNLLLRAEQAVKRQGIIRALKQAFQGKIKDYDLYRRAVLGKAGLEIGGPSQIFTDRSIIPLYGFVGALDNVQFATQTMWGATDASFSFHPQKPAGRQYILDGTDLGPIPDQSYEFVLSSHNLEHIANPLKALYEWIRVLKPNGYLILVLPDRHRTFDRFRDVTRLDHMIEDFRNQTAESDTTHYQEVIDKHDLSWDGSDAAEHRQRVLSNATLRCIHHHVFDHQNARALMEYAGLRTISVGLAEPFHIALLGQRS